MKAFGLPRHSDCEFPDMADIRHFGRASAYGHIEGKGGDIRASQRSKSKRQTRQIFKGRERQNVKAFIRSEVDNFGY